MGSAGKGLVVTWLRWQFPEGAGEGLTSTYEPYGVIGQRMRAYLGAWASCGPDLSRVRGHDEILKVSRRLFWRRDSFLSGAHTSLGPCPLPPLIKACMCQGHFVQSTRRSLWACSFLLIQEAQKLKERWSHRLVSISVQKAGLFSEHQASLFSFNTWPNSGPEIIFRPVTTSLLFFLHSLSGLGRNIILTTMPAGTKLIAGNKPVSFLTAQQLQQLQQQGQTTQVSSTMHCWLCKASLFFPCCLFSTDVPICSMLTRHSLCKQVRIQTVPASHLQQGTASGSSKAVSTVVVTTAPSPKQAPEQQ